MKILDDKTYEAYRTAVTDCLAALEAAKVPTVIPPGTSGAEYSPLVAVDSVKHNAAIDAKIADVKRKTGL